MKNTENVDAFTVEPGIFKIVKDKNVSIKNFTLGSLENWTKNQDSDTESYLGKIKIKNSKFDIPSTWEFRRGNYFFLDNNWYYSRRVGPFLFRFKFNILDNVLIFYPKIYSKIPFIYNSFYPIGYEISNLLIYSLLKKGFVVLRACALRFKNKNILIISPSCNGKTTLVKDILNLYKNTVTYIAEDIVFISQDSILGIPPDNYNFGRISNRELSLYVNKCDLIFGKVDILISYLVSDSDSCVKGNSVPYQACVEFYSHFSKSLASAVMYYENEVKLPDIIGLFEKIVEGTTVYNFRTKGYNSKKFIEYLNEII